MPLGVVQRRSNRQGLMTQLMSAGESRLLTLSRRSLLPLFPSRNTWSDSNSGASLVWGAEKMIITRYTYCTNLWLFSDLPPHFLQPNLQWTCFYLRAAQHTVSQQRSEQFPTFAQNTFSQLIADWIERAPIYIAISSRRISISLVVFVLRENETDYHIKTRKAGAPWPAIWL